MTITEKIRMYQEKKAFIDNISKAFEAKPWGSDVKYIDYEVFRKDIDEERAFFVEFLVVVFAEGYKVVRVATGNSNLANFQVLGTLLNGAYQEEIRDYETMADRGFTKVPLSQNTMLDKMLAQPMSHISNVRTCFNYCRNAEEVERVIKMIPSVFGTFSVEYPEDEEDIFVVTNDYEEDGDPQSEVAEYEFYEGA